MTVRSWRDRILKEFAPKAAHLTLVADPDGLLLEERIFGDLRERGFELIALDDPVAFRFAYESKYRSHWDRGEMTDLVIVVHAGQTELRSLPYDLLEAGRPLHFDLGDLFPNLSYPVIAALDRGDLDAVYEAQVQHDPGPLGDNATKDFVLEHVFETSPRLMKEASDLLRVLLRRHYQALHVSTILNQRLIQLLRQTGRFDDWPLEVIIPNRAAFFRFLQERWAVFVERQASAESHRTENPEQAHAMEFVGPMYLPFNHDDIRVFVDNLFLDGILKSVDNPDGESLAQSWVSVGIRINPESDTVRRLERMMASLEISLPAAEAKYQDWLGFAPRWAELSLIFYGEKTVRTTQFNERMEALRLKVDDTFTTWVCKRYASLHNQPPAMLHHLPRLMAREVELSPDKKVALIVIDGLAFDQWVVLKEELAGGRPQLRMDESGVFAWLPTLTSVSRQATFAGKAPLYYPTSIYTTDKERRLWTRFWLDDGLDQSQIEYVKGMGEERDLALIEDLLSHASLRVFGLVVDKVDKIMHGMELGTAGMHNQVRQWAQQGFMAGLLQLLVRHGFVVFLTSDHGNIEALGCGRPAEGAAAEHRGERARIYSDEALRRRVSERFPKATVWPPVGLPEEYLPLFAPRRAAFVREGERVVAHGGMSLEELIVPLVRVSAPRD